MKQRVALYCRVSLSNGSQTTENQRIRLVEYATQNNFTYDIYEEEESTRKTRPVKQALLAKLRNHDYDAVVVYKLDRWARSSTELIMDVSELVKKALVLSAYLIILISVQHLANFILPFSRHLRSLSVN